MYINTMIIYALEKPKINDLVKKYLNFIPSNVKNKGFDVNVPIEINTETKTTTNFGIEASKNMAKISIIGNRSGLSDVGIGFYESKITLHNEKKIGEISLCNGERTMKLDLTVGSNVDSYLKEFCILFPIRNPFTAGLVLKPNIVGLLCKLSPKERISKKICLEFFYNYTEGQISSIKAIGEYDKYNITIDYDVINSSVSVCLKINDFVITWKINIADFSVICQSVKCKLNVKDNLESIQTSLKTREKTQEVLQGGV